MGKFIDLTGQQFGRLLVIRRVGQKGEKTMWLCLCDCGNEAIVSSGNLRSETTSCGCYQKEQARKAKTKHGMSHSALSYIWVSIKQRCFNKKNKGYKNYGGRGIKICKEWINSFQAFYDYVSQLPHCGEKGYSLDRINNDGNYEPGNVRWATRSEQNRNRRRVRTFKNNGQTHTLQEWSELTGIPFGTIEYRYRQGKSPSEILSKERLYGIKN